MSETVKKAKREAKKEVLKQATQNVKDLPFGEQVVNALNTIQGNQQNIYDLQQQSLRNDMELEKRMLLILEKIGEKPKGGIITDLNGK